MSPSETCFTCGRLELKKLECERPDAYVKGIEFLSVQSAKNNHPCQYYTTERTQRRIDLF
jgi:hypothetical protein